ncbi:MAG: hypothetical protein QNJ32_11445 [Xenococcaceae cyanobacterium MO_167.B27]|nr:hypothetical protein [Xenococcaceae cyanobacterium MO_167.B27]
MTSYSINLKPLVEQISDSDFERLCASNPELKLEKSAVGNLNNPSSLSGENILPNLVVDLSDIF